MRLEQPCRENVTLLNDYFMAGVKWLTLKKRLEKGNQLKQRYKTTIFDDTDKGYIAAVMNKDAKNIYRMIPLSTSKNQRR